LDADGKAFGKVGVRFVDLTGQLWTRGGRASLVDQLQRLVVDGFANDDGSAARPALTAVIPRAVTGPVTA